MWSVVGHGGAVAALERSLREGRLAHAYLITGPAQVGKGRLALDLAKAVNCVGEGTRPSGEGTRALGEGTRPCPTEITEAAAPCGQCRPCRLIEAGRHADFEAVGVAGLCDQSDHDHVRDGSKDIKICQVRRLERLLSLRPFEARRRVVVIDPAEALNAYASDALLKTLEEPPEQSVIIVIATDAGVLPETVVSRARRVALGPLRTAEVRDELLRRGSEPAAAELLATLSGGRMGWALSHAANEALAQERTERLQRIESLVGAGRAERMAFAGQLAARFSTARDEVFATLDLFLSWWRDLLLVGEGCEDLIANSDRLVALRAAAKSIAPAGVVHALEALRTCRKQLEDNANARLALEVLVMRLPSPVNREEAGPRWGPGMR